MELRIDFYSKEEVSIRLDYTRRYPFPANETSDLFLFICYTLRQLSNLGNHPVAMLLAVLLTTYEKETIKKLSHGIYKYPGPLELGRLFSFMSIEINFVYDALLKYIGSTLPNPISYRGEGKKAFVVTLPPFQLFTRGFGSLGIDVNYYALQSVISLIRYFGSRHIDDDTYLFHLSQAAKQCGEMHISNGVPIGDQVSLANDILKGIGIVEANPEGEVIITASIDDTQNSIMEKPSTGNLKKNISYCQNCGRINSIRYVELYQVIGAIFVRFTKSIEGNLCKECISKYFWPYTFTTLIFGWWGVISFLLTPFILLNNIWRYLGTKVFITLVTVSLLAGWILLANDPAIKKINDYLVGVAAISESQKETPRSENNSPPSLAPTRVRTTTQNNDCPEIETSNWFKETDNIHKEFDSSSSQAKASYFKQKSIKTPKCLETLQKYTVAYYNYAWKALDYHEKGQDINAEIFIDKVEETSKKIITEMDRLAKLYDWVYVDE
jgi:hypothetical protein